MADIEFHASRSRRRLAFRHVAGPGPTLVFLPGYKSDMAGSKATALLAWAEAHGRACLLVDYSGCGASPGDFADGTLGRWAEDVVGVIGAQIDGPVVLAGSSMGGWIMLLAAAKLGAQVAGLVGIAAAPDFTEWGFDAQQKARLAAGETIYEDNPYGPEPTPFHASFWRDGQQHLMLGSELAIDVPVRLLHGQQDADVPPDISLRLAAALRSQDVQVTLIKGGDHRLSRESDIALLLQTTATLT
jgi:pimeloyl-ACP methyl ester carboxylesterase